MGSSRHKKGGGIKMDKKMVSVILWALGCLGILLAPGHAITVAAEVACAARR